MPDPRPYSPAGGGSSGSGSGTAPDLSGLLSAPQISGQTLSFAVRGSAARAEVTLPAAMATGAGAVRYIEPINLTATVTIGARVNIEVTGQGTTAPDDGTALLFFSPGHNTGAETAVHVSLTEGTDEYRREVRRADGSALAGGEIATGGLLLLVYRAADTRWLAANIPVPPDALTAAEIATLLNGEALLAESSLDVNVQNALRIGANNHLERVNIPLDDPSSGSFHLVSNGETYETPLGATAWEAILVAIRFSIPTSDGSSARFNAEQDYFFAPGQSRSVRVTYRRTDGSLHQLSATLEYRTTTDPDVFRVSIAAGSNVDSAHPGTIEVSRITGLRVATGAVAGLSEAEVDGRIELVTSTQRLYYTRSATAPGEPTGLNAATVSGTPAIVSNVSFTRSGGVWYRDPANASGTDPLYAIHLTTLTEPGGDHRVYAGAPALYADPREPANLQAYIAPTDVGGTADAIVLMTPHGLARGRRFVFQAEAANTGPMTLAIQTPGNANPGLAVAMVRRDLSAFEAGDIAVGQVVVATLDIDGGPRYIVDTPVPGETGTGSGDPAALSFNLVGEANYQTTRSASFRTQFAAATDPANDIDIRGVSAVFAVRVEEHQYALMDREQVLGYEKSVGDNAFIDENGTGIHGVPTFVAPEADSPLLKRSIALAWDATNNRLLVSAEAVGDSLQPMPLRVYSLSGDVPDGAVRYDEAQTLEAGEQAQARTNIGAISLAEVPSTEIVGFVSYQDDQTLTTEQQATARANIGAAAVGAGNQANLAPVVDSQAWAATDLTPHWIAGTFYQQGLGNEVPDGDPFERNFAAAFGTPRPLNPLPIPLAHGYTFRHDTPDSFAMQLREWPTRLLIAFTWTPDFRSGQTVDMPLIDFDSARLEVSQPGRTLRFRELDATPAVHDLISAALPNDGTAVRLALYIRRTAERTYQVALASSHAGTGATISPITATFEVNQDLHTRFAFGARRSNAQTTSMAGEVRDIVVAEPHADISLAGSGAGTLREMVDANLRNAADASSLYGVIRRVTPHAIDGALQHGVINYHQTAEALAAGDTATHDFTFAARSAAGRLADFAEVEIIETTPADEAEQLELLRTVGTTQYLEGTPDANARRVFTAADFDGDRLRLAIRNNGPTALTAISASVTGYVSAAAGVPVDALPEGYYGLTEGTWYWFPRHYHLADLELIHVGFSGGQRSAVVLRPSDIVVSTDGQHNDRSHIAGDWQIYGWSGDGANFEVWGGGSITPRYSAWSLARPKRRVGTQAGTWGGIYAAAHNHSARAIRYIRLTPKRGVIL